MSYILDALRRAEAERERKRGAAAPSVLQEPPPAAPPAVPGAQPGPAPRPALPAAAWVAGGVALVLAGTAAWLALRSPADAGGNVRLAEGGAGGHSPVVPTGPQGGAGTPPDARVMDMQPQAAAPAADHQPPGEAAAPAAPRPAQTADGSLRGAPLPAPSGTLSAAPSIAPPPPALPAPAPPLPPPAMPPADAAARRAAPSRDPAAAAAHANGPQGADRTIGPQGADRILAPGPANAAPTAPAGTRASAGAGAGAGAGAVAGLPPLPEALQRQLAISGSRYADDPAQRLLIVNGQVVREGGALAPGLTLEQIKLRTAVISHQGQRYELRY